MYSAELERHKKEKEEWRKKAQRLEDQASALQVNQQSKTDQRIHSLYEHVTYSEPCIFLDDSLMKAVITEGVLLSVRLTSMKPTLLSIQRLVSPISSI